MNRVPVKTNWIEVLLYIAAFALLFMMQQAVWATEDIGKVISATGKVVATGKEGSERVLKRRSSIFEGDRIQTDKAGNAQIRFTDGSLLALKPETDFSVKEYQLQSSPDKPDKASYELLKGGMRTITGLIGKSKQDQYVVKTPVASIGIRGTDFELFMTTKLVAAVWSGGIHIDNEAGAINLGKDQGYQFANVESTTEAPAGLLEAPESLGTPLQNTDATSDATEESSGTESKKENDASGEDKSVVEGSDAGEVSELAGFEDSSSVTTAEKDATEVMLLDAQTLDSAILTTADVPTDFIDPVTSSAVNCPPDDLQCQLIQTTPVSDPIAAGSATAGVSAAPGSLGTIAFLFQNSSGGYQGQGGPVPQGSDSNFFGPGMPASGDLRLDALNNLAGLDFSDGKAAFQFFANAALVNDVGSNAALQVNWGRWSGSYFANQNGIAVPAVGSLHFMVSPNATTDAELKAFTGSIGFSSLATFSYAGGTSPTDQVGNVGLVGEMHIVIDPHNLWFVDAVLNVMVDQKLFVTKLDVPFMPLSRNFSFSMGGTCEGANCASTIAQGRWSGGFVGDSANGIITSYHLTDGSLKTAITGAALLARDPFPAGMMAAPIGVSALGLGFIDTAASTGAFSKIGIQKTSALDFSNSSNSGSEVMLNSTRQPLYVLKQGTANGGGIDCQPCGIYIAGNITAKDVGGDALGVNWGRWEAGAGGSIASVTSTGQGSNNINNLHFIYTENITPSSQITAGTPLTGLGVAQFVMTPSMGTRPTDQFGNVGFYANNATVNVDFSSLIFQSVSLQFGVNGVDYALGLAGASPSLLQVHEGVSTLALAGNCPSNNCGGSVAGNLGGLFVGANAEGLIGNFAAYTADGKQTVTGAGFFKR